MQHNGLDSKTTACRSEGSVGGDLEVALHRAPCTRPRKGRQRRFSRLPNSPPDAEDTRVARKIFPYSGLRPLESLIAAIEATHPQILVPCDDRAVRHLHELHARARALGPSGNDMAALIENSIGPSESYPIVRSRYDLLKIAREEGVRVPETERIDAVADFKSWQVQQTFPWVIKADGTFGGHGVKITHTLEQAEQSFSELSRFYCARRAVKRLCVNRDAFWVRPWWNGIKPVISVQSYIHGRPTNCAVVCWKGRVLAGIGVEVVSAAGPTGPASVVRVMDNSDMLLSAKQIASRLGLSGFYGFDFMFEERSGLTYLIEMNPRPTRVSRLQLGKGRDQVGALLRRTLRSTVTRRTARYSEENDRLFPGRLVFKERVSGLKLSRYAGGRFGSDPRDSSRPGRPGRLLWRLANEVERMKRFWRGPGSADTQTVVVPEIRADS